MFLKITCIALLWCTGGKSVAIGLHVQRKGNGHTHRGHLGALITKCRFLYHFPQSTTSKQQKTFLEMVTLASVSCRRLEALQCYVDLLVPNNCA